MGLGDAREIRITAAAPAGLTEDDVRRIVREELARALAQHRGRETR